MEFKNIVYDPKIDIIGKEVPLQALEQTGKTLQDRYDKSYENELQFGDEIKRIGQYVLSEMDFCDIIQLKNFRNNNESYELEVLSKDNTTKIVKIDNK
jgi:hypothetical protein